MPAAGNAVGSAEECVGGKTKSHFVLDRILIADRKISERWNIT